MTKPTKWSVRQMKTQISLGIPPVWAESLQLHLMGSWEPNVSSCGQRRLWSDWVDAQADLSLCWAQRSFCWFCHEAAQLLLCAQEVKALTSFGRSTSLSEPLQFPGYAISTFFFHGIAQLLIRAGYTTTKIKWTLQKSTNEIYIKLTLAAVS